MGILVGACLVVASVAAFYLALPREGRVARFLRSNEAQSYYVVAILTTFVTGSLMILVNITGLDPGGQFQ
jgi:hypothetical protein